MKNHENEKKTIIDIAKESNVSIATVSRYFSNPDLLAPKTREKLKLIIEKNAFFPSIISRSKRIKNVVRISYFLDQEIQKGFFFDVINGIIRGCLIYNYVMMLFLNQKERKEHIIDNVIRNNTTYIISTQLQPNDLISVMEKNRIKFCYLLPISIVKERKWTKDDILVSYDDNFKDGFTLGLISVSLVKNELNKINGDKKEKFHKFIKDDFTFIDLKI